MRLHVGEIRDPESIRRIRHELTVDEVARTRQLVVAEGRSLETPAAPGAQQSLVLHEPLNGASSDRHLLAVQLFPDLARAVNGEVVVVDTGDLGLQLVITVPSRARGTGLGRVVGGGSKLQCLADWLDSPSIPA